MLNSLLYPATAAAGLLVAEKVGGFIQPRLQGSQPPTAARAALARFGTPAALFALGHFVKARGGKLSGLGTGAQIGAAVHLFAEFLGSTSFIDPNLTSY